MNTLTTVKRQLSKFSRSEIKALADNEFKGEASFNLLYALSLGKYESDIGYQRLHRIAGRLERICKARARA
jgi:hypothetical protein